MENTHNCPVELWKKLSDEDKEIYNKFMERSDYREWMENDGESINDHKILSHNFLICVLDSFNK